MNLSATDERLLHRFLDGELTEPEAAACRARLEADAAFHQGWLALEGLRRVVGAAKPASVAAPAGFTASVLAAARRLPSREQLRELEAERVAVGQGVMTLCRRLLIAAAVLFCLGLAWQSGLFGDRRDDMLQAAPGDVQREMDRLDSLIQNGAVRPEGATGSGSRGERQGK
jgi:anti-sigma factor RsiW